MPQKRIDIMDIKQLILLKSKKESNRYVAKVLDIDRNTVNYYVSIFKASGFEYCELLELDQKSLEDLFPSPDTTDSARFKALSSAITQKN